jgi:hypothetical protein
LKAASGESSGNVVFIAPPSNAHTSEALDRRPGRIRANSQRNDNHVTEIGHDHFIIDREPAPATSDDKDLAALVLVAGNRFSRRILARHHHYRAEPMIVGVDNAQRAARRKARRTH